MNEANVHGSRCMWQATIALAFERSATLVRVCLIVITVLLSVERMHAELFHFSGEVQYSLVAAKADSNKVETLRFEVKLGDEAWWIRTTDPAELRPAISYIGNGSNLCFFTDWTNTRIKSTNLSVNAESSVNAPWLIKNVYKIYPGDSIPRYYTDLVFPLWLAFVSKGYFSPNITNEIPDFTGMGLGVMGKGVPILRAEIRRGDSGRLWPPDEIFFYNTGVYWTSRNEEAPELHPWPPPFSKGFLRAKFSTLEYKATDGYDYVSRATLEVFYPSSHSAHSNHLAVLTRATVLTEMASHNLQDVMPSHIGPDAAMAVPILVTDYRTRTALGEPSHYFSTNGFIQTKDSRFARLR